ncbi:MAG: homocysteine S-methyltransferase family protein [Clostridia bacterium]|nr:homocysteine S-methyltransferase family protein [Clostridia bacterium]
MKITDILGKRLLFFDGGMGTMLQKNGLKGGEIPELLNITNKPLIEKIHTEYLEAGADIITTNTFGANPLKADEIGGSVELLAAEGTAIAKKCVARFSTPEKPRFVAFDIGPTGRLLEPLGDLSFDDCYDAFKSVAVTAEKSGADLAIIETMSDTLEAKAALLAVKENTSLPVFCTMTFDETGKTLTGADVVVMCAMLEGLGADCIGINCGLGPAQISSMMEQLAKYASIPIMAQPNAGLPQLENGKTVYDVTPEQFGEECRKIAALGASVLGGCCGTTPDHIRSLISRCKGFTPKIEEKPYTVVTSYSKAVLLDNRPVIIGERINPTGKKKFKEALKNQDINYILSEAFSQLEAGADILDVNVGLPEIDECSTMERAVKAISASVNLPLQIDSSDPATLERALRIYNGKPMVNSVNGKRESLDAILPIVQKYGGVLVGLCLDEDGIPSAAEDRVEIARKIADEAQKYGIKKKDLVMDALTLTVSAQQTESAETIKALKLIKETLGIKTVLGVSNISFGLPRRELINGTFFAMALNNGLDACIINPCADTMMNTYRAYKALTGIDENCADYVQTYAGTKAQTTVTGTAVRDSDSASENPLYDVIIKGLKDKAAEATEGLLTDLEPMEIINKTIIPALDYVGDKFEKGIMFLPQLMMSAETVKNAFAVIKAHIENSGEKQESRGRIVLATVKGDIHDIGKNIVKVLLENYGYDVIDLGKDVAPELIVETLQRENIPLCGLSALMTTTVVSMEDTIKLIRKTVPDVKVFVGGAVLNREYADMIGADAYCKDALASVNFANDFYGFGDN